MKNAIGMPGRHNWIKCSTIENFVRLLCDDIGLIGRKLIAHGAFTLDAELVSHDIPLEESGKQDFVWLLIDDGLLLLMFPWPDFAVYCFPQPFVLWMPNINENHSLLVETCRFHISTAKTERVTKDHREKNVKKEIGLHVRDVLFLPDDQGLHAFPFTEFPNEYFLNNSFLGSVRALGLIFHENEYTGFLDLLNCEVFIQSPEWRYSRSVWFKKEPQLASSRYAYVILMAGDEHSWFDCDGSEDRECLMIDLDFGSVGDMLHQLVNYAVLMGGMPFEIWFSPREEWISAMRDWELILEAKSWEALAESLSQIDRNDPPLEKCWNQFPIEFGDIHLAVAKQAIRYLYDWVGRIIDAYGGISTYRIF